MELNEMVDSAHATAVVKGWWDACMTAGGDLDVDSVVGAIPLRLALIHGEISKALEILRDSDAELDYTVSDAGKPVGFAVKLADVVIRIGDLAGAMGVDLEAAVRAKLAYNETRPYLHGGKRF